jgi:hypothetical protein
MKFLSLFSIVVFFASQPLMAQKYFTKTGQITFFSDTPLEKIEGINKSSNCVLDIETGKVEFAALIKGFQFDKALMQEHFNENYMESNKFPKATFKGQINNYSKIDLTKDGKSSVKVSGDLTIHGVTKPISTDATLTVKAGKLDAATEFNLQVSDYNIEIPSLVKDQIAKSVKVSVIAKLEPFK